MLDIVLEESGPFELAFPHLTESARLYVWRTQFLDLLDKWGSCRSSNLSKHQVVNSETAWKAKMACVQCYHALRINSPHSYRTNMMSLIIY